MLKLLVIGNWLLISFFSSAVFAVDAQTSVGPSECQTMANEELRRLGGNAPFFFDENGKTKVILEGQIEKRTLENNLENKIETLIYKSKMPYFNMTTSKYEEGLVPQSVVITRNREGKLISISSPQDVSKQVERAKLLGFTNVPVLKSTEANFSYKGSDCFLNQTLNLVMQNENAKVEKKVLYDKAFCDRLAPYINRMGSQNASQCASLIGLGQEAFDQRNKELAIEGKAFQEFNYLGTPAQQDKSNLNQATFNLGSAIQTCALPNILAVGFGYPGPGSYGGFNPYGGGIYQSDTKAKADAKTPVSSTPGQK